MGRFSPDHKKLHFAVTDENCIYEYDFNTNTGELSNKKIFAKGCCPDGITVDSKGNLWVANCCPSEPLLCYSKNGEIIDKIYFDTYRIISVAFGGENNDLLFVTTACQNEQSDGKNGGVFVVEKVGTGAQEYIFHIEKECR